MTVQVLVWLVLAVLGTLFWVEWRNTKSVKGCRHCGSKRVTPDIGNFIHNLDCPVLTKGWPEEW